MKSKFTNSIKAALGVCLLMCFSVAQAAGPVCSPTYGPVDIANGNKVTLTANCNPGIGDFIPGNQYKWESSAPGQNPWVIVSNAVAPSTNTAATLTVLLPAEGTKYRVSATSNVGGLGSASAGLDVFSGPPICVLNSISPPGTSVTVTAGQSAILLPTCHAATSIDWYADVPVVNTLIPAPPGGAVTPSTTTKYYIIGSNAYGSAGSNQVTVNTVAALSGCSISPASVSKTTGATGQLFTASCNSGTPTSYAWTVDGSPVGGNNNTYTTASNLSVASHTVAVAIGNGGSTSNPTATLTVSTLPLSACSSISPASPSVTLGSNSPTLTANCNNSPTGYVWKMGNTTLSCTTSTCVVLAADLPSATTYGVTVTADNAGGTGTSAANATITVSLQALSACTSISPSAPNVALGANSPTLTATCNNSPTGYVWKVGNTTLVNCTGSTCSVPAANLPSATTYGVTVTANNAGGNGTAAANATITVGSAPPSSAACSDPANTVVPLSNTIIPMDWTGYHDDIIAPNASVSYSFTATGSNGSFSLVASAGGNKVISISKTPCDFSSAAVAAATGCIKAGLTFVMPFGATTSCQLTTGQTYYVNVRNGQIVGRSGALVPTAESCTGTAICSVHVSYIK